MVYFKKFRSSERRNVRGTKPLVHLFAQIRLMSTQAGSYSPQNRFNVARVMGRIFRKTNNLMFVDLDGFADNVILVREPVISCGISRPLLREKRFNKQMRI